MAPQIGTVRTYRVIDGDPSTLTHGSTPALDGQPELDWRTLLPNPDPKILGHVYGGVQIPASTFWTAFATYWETDGGDDVHARWIKDKSSKRVIGMGSAYVTVILTQKDGNGVLDYFQAGLAAYGINTTIKRGKLGKSRTAWGTEKSPQLLIDGRRKVLRLLGFFFHHASDDYRFGQPQMCNAKFRDLYMLFWICTYKARNVGDAVALDVIHGMGKVTRHDPDLEHRAKMEHGIERPEAETRLGLAPGASVGAADHITRIADDAYAQRLIRLTSVIAAGDAAYFGPSVVDGTIGGDATAIPRLCKRKSGTFRVTSDFKLTMELTGLPTLIAMTVALGLPPRVARLKAECAYIVTARLTRARPERFFNSAVGPRDIDLQPLGINAKRVNQLALSQIGLDLDPTDAAALHTWTDLLYDHLEFHGDDVRRKRTRVQQHAWIDGGGDDGSDDELDDELILVDDGS